MNLPRTVSTASSSRGAYLVTDEGFSERFGLCFVVVAVCIAAADSPLIAVELQSLFDTLQYHGSNAAAELELWAVLGLLSSSCCLIQIVLNAASFGCAGFNTVLGPLRPALLALTVGLQAANWRTVLRYGWPWSAALGGTAIAFGLALLPEALELRARHRGGAGPGAAPDGASVDVFLADGAMGCASCVATVAGALDEIPGVASANVSFERQCVTVFLDRNASEDGKDEVELVRLRVAAAGFECRVDALGEAMDTAQPPLVT